MNEICVKCGSLDDLTRDHIIPTWIYKRRDVFRIEKHYKPLGVKNIQKLCKNCNHEKCGGIDCSTEVGRDFWESVYNRIEVELNK